MSVIIDVRQLSRSFKDVRAVENISFCVDRGEIFGFLGANGAGKTTTVRMLTGFISPSRGEIMIDGHDVIHDAVRARRHIGVVPEEANVYGDLSVWNNVMLMAALYGIPKKTAHKNSDELLTRFGLIERKKEKGRVLSKGLKQRLMICMALVGDPKILFLDEPTSGLDVVSARLIRELIVEINKEKGTTVFLTTHNMQEAEQLCGRVAIMNKGKIAAIDRPEVLQETVESTRAVEISFKKADGFAESLKLFKKALLDSNASKDIMDISRGVRVYGKEPGLKAQNMITLANKYKLTVDVISVIEPGLEEVFIKLTTADQGITSRGKKG
jgi:ABC-2 type transport system ATP-binding protein